MSNYARRPARILAGVLAGALALSVTPILGFSGTAGALEPATGDGSVCEDVTPATEPFTDVQSNDVAINEIICLVATGITKGVTATTYEPTSPVTRRQMALFLVRMADEIEDNAVAGQVTPLPAGDGVTPFTDIGGESAEAKVAIDRLNEAGIAKGVTATTFVPGDAVTRRQMAKFIVRLQEFMAGADITPDNAPNAFTDDEGDSGEAELNVLAAEGVFIGNAAPNAGTVSPGANISRRQMALVIIRKLQYLFEEGVITRIFPEDDTNQAFATTQGENLVTFTTPAGTGGSRDIVFTGLPAGAIDVALFPCGNNGEDPGVDTSGTAVTFRDEEGASAGKPDNLADDEGETTEGNAFIVSINGDPAGLGSTYEDNITVPAGSVTVRVNSTLVDCVFVVVFADADDDDEVDLDANNQPTEAFGVAGPIVWFFGEAVTGYNMEGDVVYHNAAEQFWIDDSGFLMNYGRATDRYFLDCFGDPLEINLANWTEYLTVGDNTSDDQSAYNRAGPNQFENESDYPLSPAGVTAAVGDFDALAETVADDVRVTVVPSSPTGGFIENYTVERYDSTTGAFLDSVTSADGATTADFEELAPGTYLFRARANTACGSTGDLTDPVSATVSAPAPGPVVGAPISVAASAVDTDSNAAMNTGDVLSVRFNEVMAAPTAGDVITLTDSDGTVATLTNGTNATFALSADGATISITLTAGPAISVVGTTVGVQYPASATSSTGVTDADESLEWNIAGSTDVTF